MKRKVIQLASNTLVVSLPSKWVKRTSLSKGDEVNIDAVSDVLKISASGTFASRKFTIDTEKLGRDKNLLSYLYQKGYDEVEVVNIDSGFFNQLKEKSGDLMGFEIIERSEKRCMVKAVSKEMDSEFDNILRRTFLITLEMGRSLVEAIEKKDISRIGEIRSLEKTTNTFTDFCKRVISKGGYGDQENNMYMYIIVRDLEKIADGYKRICDVLLSAGALKVSKKILPIMKRANSFLETFYRLFYKFDPETLSKMKSDGKKLVKDADSLLKVCAKEEAAILSHLLHMVTTTYELIGPYFILNFDKNM